MKRLAVFILALAGLLSACSSTGVGTAAPVGATNAPGVTNAPGATPTVVVTDPPAATPTEPPAGPTNYKPGTAVVVTKDGADWAKVTVSDVKTDASYKSSYGTTEKPTTAGNVFLSAKVTYEAVADKVDYSRLDWNVYCANVSINNLSFIMYGPSPTLSSGTLPKGRIVSGYVVYEVPPQGEVDMTYVPNMFDSTPVFQVIIRAA